MIMINFSEFFKEASGFDVVFYAEPEQTVYANGVREFRSKFKKPIGANLVGYVEITTNSYGVEGDDVFTAWTEQQKGRPVEYIGDRTSAEKKFKKQVEYLFNLWKLKKNVEAFTKKKALFRDIKESLKSLKKIRLGTLYKG